MGSALRRDIQEGIFRLFTGGGIVIGLFWALDHPVRSQACKSKTTAQITECVNGAWWDAVTPFMAGMGVGAIAGAALGAFLARMLRANPSSERVGAPARQVAAPGTGTDGHWVKARFDGRCAGCGASVMAGDRLFHVKARQNLCSGCAPASSV